MKKIISVAITLLTGVQLYATEMTTANTDAINPKIFAESCQGCNMVSLTLERLVHAVIKANYELTSQKIKVDIAKYQVEMERGIYEPLMNLEVGYLRTKVPNSAEEQLSRGYLDIYKDNLRYATAGVKGLLSTGAEWNLDLSNGAKRSNLIDETQDYGTEYDGGVSFTFKQPILRNYGVEVTEAKINIAKVNEKIVLKEYSAKMVDLIASTVKEYWTLYGAQKLYENWTHSLKVTQKMLKDVELQVENGKMAATEISEVRSAILQRKAEILTYRSKIIELQNRIMSLLNISVQEYPNLFIIAIDSPEIEKRVKTRPLNESFDMALKNLPEYELTKLKHQQEQIKTDYNENQLLPDVSIKGSLSTAGLGSAYGEARDQIYSDSYVSYSIGVSVDMPLFGNKAAQENLKISKMKLQDAKLEIEASQRVLNNILNTKIEQVKSQQSRLDLYKEELSYQSELLTVEKQKLQNGKADIRDVMNYENYVFEAHRKLLNGIINWKLSETLLDKATGEIFEKFQIEVDTSNEGHTMLKNQLNKEKLTL